MKYRVIKKSNWWSSIFNTESPQYLYYDFDLEHFEVAGYNTVRAHKWEFNEEEIKDIKNNNGFEAEFFVENVREKGDKL